MENPSEIVTIINNQDGTTILFNDNGEMFFLDTENKLTRGILSPSE